MESTDFQSLTTLDPRRFEQPPNQAILINTLGMQEAEDSSAIENIVTTHDELIRDAAFPEVNAILNDETMRSVETR